MSEGILTGSVTLVGAAVALGEYRFSEELIDGQQSVSGTEIGVYAPDGTIGLGL